MVLIYRDIYRDITAIYTAIYAASDVVYTANFAIYSLTT